MVCFKMKKILIFIFAAILICGCKQEAPLTFQAGTYEVTTQGYNGAIRLSVTFSDSRPFPCDFFSTLFWNFQK